MAIVVLEVKNSRRLMMIVLVIDLSSRLGKEHVDQFGLQLVYLEGVFSVWHMIWLYSFHLGNELLAE